MAKDDGDRLMAASLGLAGLLLVALCDADIGRANSDQAAPVPTAGEMSKAGRIRIAGQMLRRSRKGRQAFFRR
jgi:hypothetical protein